FPLRPCGGTSGCCNAATPFSRTRGGSATASDRTWESAAADGGQYDHLASRPQRRVERGAPAVDEHVPVTPDGGARVADAVAHAGPASVQYSHRLGHRRRRNRHLPRRAREQGHKGRGQQDGHGGRLRPLLRSHRDLRYASTTIVFTEEMV